MVSRRVVLAALALLLAVPLLLGGRFAGSEPTFQPTATGDGPSYLDPRPVSYTHLDVYKRQRTPRWYT